MTFAVLGREPLDVLEVCRTCGSSPLSYVYPPLGGRRSVQGWVTGIGRCQTDLGAVRSSGITAPLHTSTGHAFHAEQLGRMVWLQPVREQRTLNLSFAALSPPVPDYAHAMRSIGHVLGHEGVNFRAGAFPVCVS